MPAQHKHLLIYPVSLMMLALAACAPAPIYPRDNSTVLVAPYQVAQTPERFAHADVVWGGRIIGVRNLADHTEIEILAYPLDSSQRPRINANGIGRFIAVLPGYVERLDYPQGGLVTLRGQAMGVRSGQVGQAPYAFPLVDVAAAHVWTAAELRDNGPNLHLGLGIGVGI